MITKLFQLKSMLYGQNIKSSFKKKVLPPKLILPMVISHNSMAYNKTWLDYPQIYPRLQTKDLILKR